MSLGSFVSGRAKERPSDGDNTGSATDENKGKKKAAFNRNYDGLYLKQRRLFKCLLRFPATYLCEAGFSALTLTKTKYRTDWTFATHFDSLLPIPPRIYYYYIIAGKQAQGSH